MATAKSPDGTRRCCLFVPLLACNCIFVEDDANWGASEEEV